MGVEIFQNASRIKSYKNTQLNLTLKKHTHRIDHLTFDLKRSKSNFEAYIPLTYGLN